MNRAIFALLLLVSIDSAAKECAPGRLIRMETVDHPTSAKARETPPMSRVIYRIGNDRMRVEEIPNPATGLHRLFIIDTPDLWTIDLAKRSGDHEVDADTHSVVRAPLFAMAGLPDDLLAVEHGCELEFIADPRTIHEPGGSGDKAGIKHSRQSGPWQLMLLTRVGKSEPIAAMLGKDGKALMSIKYRSYEFLDAVPEGLFAPPAGIAIRKAN